MCVGGPVQQHLPDERKRPVTTQTIDKEIDQEVDQMQNCLNIVEDLLRIKKAANERAKHNFQMETRHACLYLLLTIKSIPVLKNFGSFKIFVIGPYGPKLVFMK